MSSQSETLNHANLLVISNQMNHIPQAKTCSRPKIRPYAQFKIRFKLTIKTTEACTATANKFKFILAYSL